MIALRRSDERGRTGASWLESYHTFAFAGYRDPRHMGFRALRVINDDVIAPGQGFGAHPHRDMEIVTYILEGALAHRDSMGNGSTIRPGDLQRMSAGTGVVHRELNASETDPVHLLQIWILPERRGIEPSYEQKRFPEEERRGKLRLVASRDGREGSVTIHQDAEIRAAVLGAGERVRHELREGRGAWVHVARGVARVNGCDLGAGDAAAVEGEPAIEVEGAGEGGAEVLVFDLA